ncbi:family with sequence similarity 57, member B [Elysia marginata]|uniref:Family with sequence similarity 57, member B n=1 Tax=Elysia marginata TaxID=1093978 RepID=A0AAV4GYX0_9GAST|nr:family with sequence similarity 57, member B [Elysia marginata]
MDNFLLVSAGFSFFISAHFLIRKCLVLLWKSALSDASVYVIACRCVSALQAMLSFIVGAIVARSCRGDIMKDTHWLTNAYVYFGMPYFVFDLWAMYSYHIRVHAEAYSSLTNVQQRVKKYVSSNVMMVIHHVVLPLILSPVLLLKMKDTRLYIITSISMIVVFFFARLAIFPFLYYSYAEYANIRFHHVPFHIPVKCNFSSLLLLLPQVYWFLLMLRGLRRGLQRLSSKSK